MKPARRLLQIIIRAYQLFVSPVLPASCRYYPTCSVYAIEAIGLHGVLKGGWLALSRIAKCNPWARGGVDPVPGSEGAMRLESGELDSGTTDTTPQRTCGC